MESKSSHKSRILVIDIGGSNIRAGFLTDIEKPLFSTPTPVGRSDFKEVLMRSIENVLSEIDDIDSIVVGCPGLIDKFGMVHAALYLDIAGLNIANMIYQKFPCRIAVSNDANLQSVAIATPGIDLIYFAFGTGVGGAIVSDGKIVSGHRGFAGEVGHIPLQGWSERCLCGGVGCLDTIASGFWLERKLGAKWWNRPLNSDATKTLREAGRAVASSIALMSTLLDQRHVTMAGHLINYLDFTETIRDALVTARSSCTIEFRADTWPLVVAGARKLTSKGDIKWQQ